MANGDDLNVYFYPSESVDVAYVTGSHTAVVFAPYGDTCAEDERCSAQRCVPCSTRAGKDDNDKVCVNNVEFHRPDGVCIKSHVKPKGKSIHDFPFGEQRNGLKLTARIFHSKLSRTFRQKFTKPKVLQSLGTNAYWSTLVQV